MQGFGSAGEYLRFAITLAAVVDPFLAVPFFLAFTSAYDAQSRLRLARSIALTVFGVLALSAMAGRALLDWIGASVAAFRVGGGLVLLLMSLAMLNAQPGGLRQSRDEALEFAQGEGSGLVPLAVPLLAGPGAISTAILAGERGGAMHLAAVTGCIAAVSFLLWAVLRGAAAVSHRLGTTGLNVATRLLGLLLAAFAVQTMAEGLKQLFPGLA